MSLARADRVGQGRDKEQGEVDWCVMVPACEAGDWVSTELGRVSLLLPDNADRQRAVALLVCVSRCAATAAAAAASGATGRGPSIQRAISLDRPRGRRFGTLQEG